MELEFKLDGLDQAEKNMKELGALLSARATRSALREAAKPLEEYMKINAPVSKQSRRIKTKSGYVNISPGFLKSRIKRKASLNAKGRINRRFKKGDVAVVKTGVFRVPYVVQLEYGAKTTRQHKFIRGASSRAPEAVRIFQEKLKRKTELALKRLKK